MRDHRPPQAPLREGARVARPKPEAALDLAVDKVGHQVARIKDKRVSRVAPAVATAPTGTATATARSPSCEDDDDDDDDLGRARIVKTKRFTAKPMDPEEAALQMELLGHAFFLFTNTETGHAAVLYRRHDGDLGLIEASG